MITLKVKSKTQDYPIYIGKMLRKHLVELIGEHYSKIVIITDTQVAPHYLDDVTQSLRPQYEIEVYTVDAGEQSKSLEIYQNIQQFLLSHHIDRSAAIIALGGGVIGDLAGFVASTYMRGISFIQMPTTLLAHDSSVGGKVGINFSDTKNILGSFYPPRCVIYDTDTLNTLDEQQLRSGFAEMLKHGLICDKHFMIELNSSMYEHINIDYPSFEKYLAHSIQIKQEIVENDEHEQYTRQYLNMGHTLGHAIEAISKAQPYTHGECVMVGLLFDLYLSDRINEDTKLLNDDLLQWISKLGYPLNIIHQNMVDLLIRKMKSDKKNSNQQIKFVLLKNYGEPYLQSLNESEAHEYLKSFIKFLSKGRLA